MWNCIEKRVNVRWNVRFGSGILELGQDLSFIKVDVAAVDGCPSRTLLGEAQKQSVMSAPMFYVLVHSVGAGTPKCSEVVDV